MGVKNPWEPKIPGSQKSLGVKNPKLTQQSSAMRKNIIAIAPPSFRRVLTCSKLDSDEHERIRVKGAELMQSFIKISSVVLEM